MSQVALTRCEGYDGSQVGPAIRRQFELLGIDKLVGRGDLVLIKPNMIAPRPPTAAVQTDPAVITEVARCLVDLGARPIIGDSPAWGTLDACVEVLGLYRMLRPMHIQIVPLNRPRRCLLADGKTRVLVSSVPLEAGLVINVPKFKSHQQMMFTFAVKNLFGCVPGKIKPFWHLARGKTTIQFSRFLIHLCQLIRPAVTIIDAVVAMEGPGPINGRPRHLGYLIGAIDPIEAEVICSRLVGVDPLKVPVIAAARGLGLVPDGPIQIDGDPLDVCKDFQIPALAPIRFSPTRVARSVVKGVFAALRGQPRSKADNRPR